VTQRWQAGTHGAGVYFARVRAGDATFVRRFLLAE
jgi:hypothetical protein